jgi:hypothetical protein
MTTSKIASLFFVSLVSACGNGNTDIVATVKPDNGVLCLQEGMNLSDCQVVGPVATPPPTQTNAAATLKITGDEPTPPVSSWTNQGFSNVPFSTSPTGSGSMFDTLGINNQAPISKLYPVPTLKDAGNCTQVNLKVKVSNPAPQCFQGMNSLQSHAGNFKVCNDGGDVVVKFEDGADTLFNDYQFRIHEVNNRPLAYKFIGTNLFVCLQ